MSNIKLKKIRNQLGLTQQQAAALINTSKRNWQHYESGDRNPNMKTALRIAKAFNTTVENLFG